MDDCGKQPEKQLAREKFDCALRHHDEPELGAPIFPSPVAAGAVSAVFLLACGDEVAEQVFAIVERLCDSTRQAPRTEPGTYVHLVCLGK